MSEPPVASPPVPLPESTPALIIGAGPTGLTAAIELVRRGIEVLVVDQRPEPLPWDRATVIHSRTLEILDTLGIVDDFLQRGHRMLGVNIFAYGSRCASLPFDGIDSRYPFDLNLSEQITEAILSGRLAELGGRIHRGWTLLDLEAGPTDVRARLQGDDGTERTVAANWLIGADGIHSTVRRVIGLEVEGHAYDALWGVVDGELRNWMHDPCFGAVQIEPPSVNPLPLPDGRWRVYFRADHDRAPQEILALIDQGLDAVSPGASLGNPDEPRFFRTYRQLSRSFRAGRVLLAGDAAHACSPIEGHGMNAGIQDAFNLGWKLALVLQGRAAEPLLDTYGPERRPVVESFGASGDAAETLRAVPDDRAAVERVKRTIMAGMSSPRDRYQAALAESELDFRYGDSAIVAAHHPGGAEAIRGWLGACPGDRVPDAEPLLGPAGPLRLYDLLRDPGFVVLWFATDRTEVEVPSGAIEALEALATVRFLTTASWAPLPAGNWLLDADGMAHARFGAIDPTVVVLRPDNRVGFRCEPPDLERVLAYFRSWSTAASVAG